jgi:hypothetical protein
MLSQMRFRLDRILGPWYLPSHHSGSHKWPFWAFGSYCVGLRNARDFWLLVCSPHSGNAA